MFVKVTAGSCTVRKSLKREDITLSNCAKMRVALVELVAKAPLQQNQARLLGLVKACTWQAGS